MVYDLVTIRSQSSKSRDLKVTGRGATVPRRRMTVEPFAPDVRSLIDERGLTLTALSEGAGVDHAHLSRVLRGKKKPSLDLIRRVTRALELPEHYFGEVREAELAEKFHAHPLEVIVALESFDALFPDDLELNDLVELRPKRRRK